MYDEKKWKINFFLSRDISQYCFKGVWLHQQHYPLTLHHENWDFVSEESSYSSHYCSDILDLWWMYWCYEKKQIKFKKKNKLFWWKIFVWWKSSISSSSLTLYKCYVGKHVISVLETNPLFCIIIIAYKM